ncbi:MAG: tRNA epoxyqueuosine(34) reductase QueG [Chloracidobacterium sp.]|nr:tRNA epoxyqueuosine(34) reductase QueG [Chloracidobacterium sp.]
MSLGDAIKRTARDIGFDAVGIVAAASLDTEGDHLRGWLGREFHGTMAWMEREPEKRTDPRRLMPEARSIVVVLHNYFTPHKHADAGKISRYAWGDDYHDVLREKLNQLLEWITTKRPEANGKICVDTAPFMDKAWAVRAGLGWLGKHSNLITTTHGSWLFIGSLLLDIELDYDTEHVDDHCGTCTACIDACPTGAIVEPYVVDSNKCISYATIELRDERLPIDTAGWLYGCDICQDVCPWNRFEQPTAEPRFLPRHGETSLSPETVLSLEHDEYVNRFRHSAIKRAKLSGLKRNAAALNEKEPVLNREPKRA